MAGKRNTQSSDGSIEVDSFIASLEHPLKVVIVDLRKLVLALDSSVREEIKWNAPSFYTSEHFATMQLRNKDSVLLILHFGAKKRSLPAGAISDPDNLLKWLGPDRACVSLKDPADLATKRRALESVLRQWISRMQGASGAV